MVYVGAIESAEACEAWKREFDLRFPVTPDPDGSLFRKLTNGWVPCNILIGRDGRVVFSENEFDEDGYTKAIEAMNNRVSADCAPVTEWKRPSAGRRAARIVILGGGAGGLVAAHRLRKRLPREHRIVLIDRSPDHLFSPSLLWLMTGQRRSEQIRRPLERLGRKGIEVHRGEVRSIDLSKRIVFTESGEFAFDHLVISLGAELAPETIDGFARSAHNLYDLAGCEAIRTALAGFAGGTVAVWVPTLPFKCPAAPYEAAFLIEAMARHKGIRDKTEIHLLTPEHQPMPVAGVALGEALVGMLRQRGIQYHALFTFKELRVDTKEIISGSGESIRADLLIGVPPHRAPQVVRDAGLVGPSGWVPVDSGTLQTSVQGVYAIGDVAAVKLPNGKMLPKAGVFAHHEAEVVADNIAASVGGSSARRFEGHGYCWIELGDGRAGFAGGRFYAEPDPVVDMRRPGRIWHWGKVAFEKWWLHHWF